MKQERGIQGVVKMFKIRILGPQLLGPEALSHCGMIYCKKEGYLGPVAGPFSSWTPDLSTT